LEEMDGQYLARALELAERGRGRTSPNPIVGAVIAKDGDILGEGWHAGVGHDHAEVAAIKEAARRAGTRGPGDEGPLRPGEARRVCDGATMYVTLEPCCTQGRTPPCTTALIEAGIARVLVGAGDPSPAVDGKGIEVLRKAGILVEVAEGELALRSKRQNDGMRKSVTTGMPFVEYKYAMSLDGRVCTDSGDSCWISSEESRELVHRWRAWADAVVVGANTAARDDPLLTARGVDCARQPLRVVVDRDASLGERSRLADSVDEGPVLVICGEGAEESNRRRLEARGVQAQAVALGEDGELDPKAVCRELTRRGVQYVLLEGGARLAGAWWSTGIVDKMSAFVCPRVISGDSGGGSLLGRGAATVSDSAGLCEVVVSVLGPDTLITGYREGPF